MKYCIITDNSQDELNKINMEAVGFYQWVNVFHGERLGAEEILPVLKDCDYDVIHVRLTASHFTLIHSIRSKIGEKSQTKLVVSMDYPPIYWKRHFEDMTRVKEALDKADFVFATEYSICCELEKLIGKLVYELPYPADIDRLKEYEQKEKKNIINVLYKSKLKNLSNLKRIAEKSGARLRVVFYSLAEKKTVEKLSKSKIDFVQCRSEEELCRALSEGDVVIGPYAYRNYGKWPIYAAAVGSIYIGNSLVDASRRCFPMIYSTYKSLKGYGLIYRWLAGDREICEYIRKTASHKVEYYSLQNIKDRFLCLLMQETKDISFRKYMNTMETETKGISSELETDRKATVFCRDIKHLFGKTVLQHSKNEVAVFCLVKNGMEYLPDFLEHYNNLGVRHFIFVDNGSTDGTVEFLRDKHNVTVFGTEIPHKYYENEIRRTVIQNLIRDSWCLCVDVDELWDYPYSDRISIKSFLEYLNFNRYTAVISYMLDMFPAMLDFNNSEKDSGWKERYVYYDLTKIKKANYFAQNNNFCNYNNLADRSMKYYFGGIRLKHFGSESNRYVLIKHPLMFMDGKIEPVTDPHYCNKAYIADVSCVIKHYKFTSSFKERLNSSKNDYDFFGRCEHEEYHKVLKDNENINFYSSSAKRLENVNDLLQSGFIKVSRKYLNFVYSKK
ncbi:glycosyltransferase family 2 protein [Acetivibrio cellulolyticus]|uniref:glycosyltransferase family 2 protein n=1 Tax=Acetivibrio cellulolyticus TaxID=35830 RepID=UPI0001E3017D|nr:glycosyltransferase family 2 protein [Acetivibrio cellulolyticus]